MNCLVRAAKYLYRKKRKTILLFLLFLVINAMISGTLAIRTSSQKLTEELRRNAEGRVMLESLNPQEGFVNILSGEDSFINASIYVNDPELLEETAATLSAMYDGRAVAGAMDNTFRRLSHTIGQTERVTFLILLLTILVGFTAAGLLLAMWTRVRKKEIAVLVSLGVTKGDIFLQMLLEEMFLYVLAFTAAQAVTSWLLPFIGRNMEYLQDSDAALHLSHGGMAVVLCAGLAGVMILTGISVFPYMRKQIKEVLSEMEG